MVAARTLPVILRPIREASLAAGIKVLAICLFTVVAGLFATGIERIVWMFAGSGLLAVVPLEGYRPIAEIRCAEPSIEVKRDADGVLRYRCGSYWLLSNEDRSPALTAAWSQIKPQLQK